MFCSSKDEFQRFWKISKHNKHIYSILKQQNRKVYNFEKRLKKGLLQLIDSLDQIPTKVYLKFYQILIKYHDSRI